LRVESVDVNLKMENRVSRFDTAKLVLAVLVMVAGIWGFYYFASMPAIVRVIEVLIAAGIALVVALQTEPGRSGAAFVLEARDEVRKVVWPTRKETVQTTLVIIGTVLFVAIFLWLVDMLLLWAVRLLTGQGG
jgi:preprotein translocase subunit SecE